MFQTTIAYFMRGGPCMWPLLLCSMAVVFIAVERILYYRKAISPEAFVLQFCQLMNAGKRKEARDMAGVVSGDAASLACRVIDDAGLYGEAVESVTYELADRAVERLESHLDYLSVVIGLSPMLGLLGTITGMMGTFASMAGQMTNTAGVTSGLAEALITTIFGLIIAIAGTCVHAYLSHRCRNASLNLDTIADVLAARLKEGGGSR